MLKPKFSICSSSTNTEMQQKPTHWTGPLLKNMMNAFSVKTESMRILKTMNWWYIAAGIGLLEAIIHLVLVQNPDICYLYAQPLIKGFSVTLPEAVATVNCHSWLAIIWKPLWSTLLLGVIAYLIFQLSKFFNGIGSYHEHLGMVALNTIIILVGQITGYVMIGVNRFEGLSDLRDLTPGVGLGLLSWFTVERAGLFYREIVRGFDLFGIGAVLLGTSMLRMMNGFSRVQSFLLSLTYFAIYLALRWLWEDKGCQLWQYFWLSGRI
jgi:hypothetical protein